MVTGNKYKIVVEAYVNSGSSVPISMYNGSSYENKATVTNTSPQVFEFDYTHGTGNPLLNTYAGLGGGEFIWIRILSIKKVTGLVAAYNMIPNGDTLVDISGEGNNGTISGGVVSKHNGMYFGGKDHEISLSQITDLGMLSFSLVARVTVRSVGLNDRFILDRTASTQDLAQIYVTSSSTLSFRIRGSNGVGISSVSKVGIIKAGLSYSIVCVKDASTDKIKLSVNGSTFEEADDNTTAEISVIFRLGNSANAESSIYGFDGEIHDFKIYNYVFTEQQAIAYHNSFVKPVLVEDFSNYPVGQTI